MIVFRNAKKEKPNYYEPILIQYRKGKDGYFITQGYLMRPYKDYEVYCDYADRTLASLAAKASKNDVIGWIYISDLETGIDGFIKKS